MGLKEIHKRIDFIRKVKSDNKRIELKSFINLLHFTISCATSDAKVRKKNNKIFHKEIDKMFKDDQSHQDKSNDASLDDIMGAMNVKK